MSKIRGNIKTLGKEFKSQAVTLIVAAFSFTAALSWNEAIKEIINNLVPPGQEIMYKIANAVIVTFIAVVAILLISKFKK